MKDILLGLNPRLLTTEQHLYRLRESLSRQGPAGRDISTSSLGIFSILFSTSHCIRTIAHTSSAMYDLQDDSSNHCSKPNRKLEFATCLERPARKGHKKSRQGCFECKRRKIKVRISVSTDLQQLTDFSVKKLALDVTTVLGCASAAAISQKQPPQSRGLHYLNNPSLLYRWPMSLV